MATADAGEPEFPRVTPLRTRPPVQEELPATTTPASAPAASGHAEEEEEEGCTTPRSDEHQLKPLTTCPPAPRKPRPGSAGAAAASKRKFTGSFFTDVPADLRTVFVAVERCCRHPSRKKIRVWC